MSADLAYFYICGLTEEHQTEIDQKVQKNQKQFSKFFNSKFCRIFFKFLGVEFFISLFFEGSRYYIVVSSTMVLILLDAQKQR